VSKLTPEQIEIVDKAVLSVFREHYWHGAVPEEGNFEDFRAYLRRQLEPKPESLQDRVTRILRKWADSDDSDGFNEDSATDIAVLIIAEFQKETK
jgi:hypothetical protein